MLPFRLCRVDPTALSVALPAHDVTVTGATPPSRPISRPQIHFTLSHPRSGARRGVLVALFVRYV